MFLMSKFRLFFNFWSTFVCEIHVPKLKFCNFSEKRGLTVEKTAFFILQRSLPGRQYLFCSLGYPFQRSIGGHVTVFLDTHFDLPINIMFSIHPNFLVVGHEKIVFLTTFWWFWSTFQTFGSTLKVWIDFADFESIGTKIRHPQNFCDMTCKTLTTCRKLFVHTANFFVHTKYFFAHTKFFFVHTKYFLSHTEIFFDVTNIFWVTLYFFRSCANFFFSWAKIFLNRVTQI